MPIRKVKGGYKWGTHGKVYPSRKGAERQAAAAYASGYTGKSEIDYKDKKVDGEMIEKETLIKSIDTVLDFSTSLISKRRRGRHRPTIMRPRDYFAVKQSDTLETIQMPQGRVYLKEGQDPPPGVFVQTGPRGGKFYIDDSKQKIQEDQNEGKIAGSMSVVQVQPHNNPEREVHSEGNVKSRIDVPNPGVSTLRIIREALVEHKIPAATLDRLGYQIIEGSTQIHVVALGPYGTSKKQVKDMSGRIERAISSTGLDFERDGNIVHVEHLKDDPAIKIPDIVEDNGLVEDINPMSSARPRRKFPLADKKKLLNTNLIINSIIKNSYKEYKRSKNI